MCDSNLSHFYSAGGYYYRPYIMSCGSIGRASTWLRWRAPSDLYGIRNQLFPTSSSTRYVLISIYLSIYLSICIYAYLYLYIYISTSVSIYLSICLSIHPSIYTSIGVKTEGDKKAAKVQKLSKNEVLMVNIGSLSTGGRVLAVKMDLAKIVLTQPVCTEVRETCTSSYLQ